MRFYDLLQMDPAALKKLIDRESVPAQKRRIWAAMAVRAVLLVLFSIALISAANAVFGTANSPMAVALLCILLGVRFVDMGYRISDSLVNLGVSFGLLLIAPCVAAGAGPLTAIAIHISAFLVILVMTSQRPEMGNAGLYTFAYVFLWGNPVWGQEFRLRMGLTAVGFVICGSILLWKHGKKNPGIRFWDILRRIRLSDAKFQWQLQLAVGVGLILGIGSWLEMDRVMWAGFACGSVLGCYQATSEDVWMRMKQRMAGTIVGTAIFYLAYRTVPVDQHPMFGIVGGLVVGFCGEYWSKTACNCLGALFLASSIFGVHETLYLRVVQNFLGIGFALLICNLFRILLRSGKTYRFRQA